MEAAEIVVVPEEKSPRESEIIQETESQVQDYLQLLEGGQERRPRPPKLMFENGKQVELSPDVLRVLQFALLHMARGDVVALIPENKMLTTSDAARILNVSRPFLMQMLNKGEIGFTKVGSHHRLRLGDVLEYKQRRDERKLSALDSLAAEGQEAGNYFDD